MSYGEEVIYVLREEAEAVRRAFQSRIFTSTAPSLRQVRTVESFADCRGWCDVYHSGALWLQLSWHQGYLDFSIEPGSIIEKQPVFLAVQAVPVALLWCQWHERAYKDTPPASTLTDWFFQEIDAIVLRLGDEEDWSTTLTKWRRWAATQKEKK